MSTKDIQINKTTESKFSADANVNLKLKGNLNTILSDYRGFVFVLYIVLAIFLTIMYLIDCLFGKNLITSSVLWTFLTSFIIMIILAPFYEASVKPLERFFYSLADKRSNK